MRRLAIRMLLALLVSVPAGAAPPRAARPLPGTEIRSVDGFNTAQPGQAALWVKMQDARYWVERAEKLHHGASLTSLGVLGGAAGRVLNPGALGAAALLNTLGASLGLGAALYEGEYAKAGRCTVDLGCELLLAAFEAPVAVALAVGGAATLAPSIARQMGRVAAELGHPARASPPPRVLDVPLGLRVIPDVRPWQGGLPPYLDMNKLPLGTGVTPGGAIAPVSPPVTVPTILCPPGH